MNILIVGNGFDLSHYLPTKYDHFMDVMGAIEAKDTGGLPENLEEKEIDEWLNLLEKTFQKREGIASTSHGMAFDELFSKTRDPKFIEKTKEFYLTESVEMCTKDVLRLQYRLELNCWYQYFKKHVNDVKTWIDFEQKIEEVLSSFAQAMSFIEQINNKSENSFTLGNLENTVGKRNTIVLNCFHIFENKGMHKGFNAKFCYGKNDKNGMNPSSFLEFTHKQLEELIEIFNLYLELIVSKLFQNTMIEINAKEWSYPDKIFSFNYTNTYQRLHDSVNVEYLHGSCGEYQNIVLGVSDLEDESLKKIKAYGFTKYQQKLFKDTNYLFLDNFKSKVNRFKEDLIGFNKSYAHNPSEIYQHELKQRFGLNLNVYIWGHSLDISDKDYILDLFSLNDDIDRNVRVTVYYFDKTAKFSLLNNLLAILDKDKVEQWMKNKWLCFKPNPEIKFLAQESPDVDQAS
ncbi:bacteriophage abortive infection AbiH family protein [Acinetobacter johnsonii]|uniref:bacteriophage abortive infection AbiH family protein n=1 Tax=Acinetobacter johnsonii TaxID=40214 RepID=UPI0021673907|nr:bacteriophage abortive infection AbiH family protein [Acinetobacter johnsonii]MCS3525573.1 hypothetical protein [Acinetobacter johnsonii]